MKSHQGERKRLPGTHQGCRRRRAGADNYSISATTTACHRSRHSTGAGRQPAGAVDAVRDVCQQEAYLPDGVKIVYPYDADCGSLINSVIQTIIEAVILVFLVMWLFCRTSATLIPTLAVPVVAKHVRPVAAVRPQHQRSRHVRHGAGHRPAGGRRHRGGGERRAADARRGLSPVEATRKSMGQIRRADRYRCGAVGSVYSLARGSAGIIYRQFAVTIVIAMTLSVLVALIFTPALCNPA